MELLEFYNKPARKPIGLSDRGVNGVRSGYVLLTIRYFSKIMV